MDIYFIRHGMTNENKQHVYYGKKDTGLSKEGREQIAVLKEWVSEQSFDRIYVSPLPRAVETAELLLPGRSYVLEPRLEERNFGIFEQKTYAQIVEQYPEEADSWEQDWIHYQIPMGESFAEVQSRVDHFANELRKKSYDKVLIVSHKGTMIQLITALLELPKETFWKFSFEQGCYSRVSITYGNAVLTALNQKM